MTMEKTILIVTLLLIALVVTGCIKKTQEPVEEPVQELTQEPVVEQKQLERVFIEVLAEGTGDREVKSGDKISVHYVGRLEDGTEFDSSFNRGEPFTFTIGLNQVIQGWEQGLLEMKVGEKIRLTIPSNLAYGERGSGSVIPPNALLVFEVELVSFAE